MAAVETTQADKWLITRLKADATLTTLVGARIYNASAAAVPQTVTYPYVVVAYGGGTDSRGIGNPRIWHRGTWLVKVVDTGGSLARAETVYDRVDELLDNQQGTTAAATIYTLTRQSIVQYSAAIEAGKSEVHLGGLYFVRVRLTA